MNIKIKKSDISGKIKIPSSKSYTHRSLICASLAKGKTKIIFPLSCEDTNTTSEILKQMGIEIKRKNDYWLVYGQEFKKPKNELFCKGSGTTIRFMTSICSTINQEYKLTGNESLLKRPIKPLVDSLNDLGVKCSCNGNFPPVSTKGKIKGGFTKIRGDISSQFISSLLLASPLSEKNIVIEVDKLESIPYVEMTIDTQKKFGIEVKNKKMKKFEIEPQIYKKTNYKIEGDWSSASFFIAAGILAGKIEIENLNMKSLQADKKIMDVIEKMGGDFTIKKNSILVEKSKLSSINFDVSNCPDIFPVICILCSAAEGTSSITGIKRLEFKETNRINNMVEGLKKTGIQIMKKNDDLMIKGCSKFKLASIDPKNDHRVAMAFGVLGLIVKNGLEIKDSQCVNKSFSDFWKSIKNLGGITEAKK